MVEFLVLLARKAYEVNPGLPIPRYEPTEISLSPGRSETSRTHGEAPDVKAGEISLANQSSERNLEGTRETDDEQRT